MSARSAPDIVPLTPIELRRLRRGARAASYNRAPARRPGERRRRRRTTRACSCTTCCWHDPRRRARATTPTHVADVLAGHGADSDARARAGRPPRAPLPVGGVDARRARARRSRASTGSRRRCSWRPRGSTRSGSTTACSTRATTRPGGCGTTRVADVPAAKVQAFVLGRGRARSAACGCGCATSTCNPRSTTIPSRGSPTPTTSPRSRRSCAPRSSACGTTTTGAASPTPTCAARAGTARSVATAPRRGEPSWPVLATERRDRDERAGSVRVHGRSSVPRSSSASGRSSQRVAGRRRAAADRPARRRGRAPRRRRRGAVAARRASTSSRSCRSARGSTPTRARCSPRRLGIDAARDRGLDGRRQQPAAARQRVRRRASSAASCDVVLDRRRRERCTPAGAPGASRASSSRGRPATTRRARG